MVYILNLLIEIIVVLVVTGHVLIKIFFLVHAAEPFVQFCREDDRGQEEKSRPAQRKPHPVQAIDHIRTHDIHSIRVDTVDRLEINI